MRELLKIVGLKLIDVEVIDYHGGSLRVIAGHVNGNKENLVEDMIEMETKEGLFSVSRYEKYFIDILSARNKFMEQVEKSMELGKTLFGIGAAAKANTLLTFYGLDSTYLNFIVDASKFKQGKITPVTKIPIYDDSHVISMNDAVGVLLAWNISEEVKKKILSINIDVEFMHL